MKVVIAIDSFKGSLDSRGAGEATRIRCARRRSGGAGRGATRGLTKSRPSLDPDQARALLTAAREHRLAGLASPSAAHEPLEGVRHNQFDGKERRVLRL